MNISPLQCLISNIPGTLSRSPINEISTGDNSGSQRNLLAAEPVREQAL